MSSPHRAPERLFVGALSFTEIVSWGVLYYTFGVLVEPMRAELGWSQGLLGAGFSLALLVSALLAVPVGRALVRHGPRAVMTLGSCAGAVLVYAWSRVTSPLEFFALCAALGFPLASTLYEAAFTTVIARLGAGRRTDGALLVLTIVAGLASTVFVPLTQALVEAHGWRGALRVLAVVLGAATIPLHAWVLSGAELAAAHEPRATRTSALPARRLYLSAAAFALATLAGVSLGVYLVPILIEQGFDARLAAWAAGAIGIGQVLGRIGFTALRPRYSLAVWSAALFAPSALGLLGLALHPPAALLWPAVLLFALASGAQTLARATWTMELFELADFARVNGVLGLWSLSARAAAPLLLGAAHDLCGSHGPGLVTLAALSALGGLCAWRATR